VKPDCYWWPFGWIWCWVKHGGHLWADDGKKIRCYRCGCDPYFGAGMG
jgi:hypothetical protein